MHPTRHTFTLGLVLALLAGSTAAQVVQPLVSPHGQSVAKIAAPRIADVFNVTPFAHLEPLATAEPDRLAAMQAWNQGHHRPTQAGLVRQLPSSLRVELSASLRGRGVSPWQGGLLAPRGFENLGWGTALSVAGADRLRLHLAAVHLPRGSRLWVSGGGEERGPFGPELVGPDGGLWTPSVGGETVALDVEVPLAGLAPGERPAFVIDQVAELVPKDNTTTGPCDTDLSCAPAGQFPDIDTAKHGIASIEFVDSGGVFICSGGLLNDSRGDGVPYFLTANHCISTSASAASLEAFWDFYTTSCGGPPPSIDSVPTTNGSTLLATGSADNASDYTLLQLSGVPPGRTYLGWNANANAAPNGTNIFRLSAPGQEPLDYCVTMSNSSVPDCGGPRSDFLYSSYILGGTFGGSSGAPSMLANGMVVGQLYGGCNNPDDCSPQQYTIDGGFYATFPNIAPWLAPGGGGTTCRPNSTTLCLQGKRFSVQVNWTNQFNSTSGVGHAVPASDSSGSFYFTDPGNYELILKLLNFGTTFKFFYGELTDLQFTITVTDNQTGNVKTYSNTPGDCGAIDETAFPVDKAEPLPSNAAPGKCVANSHTLCLLGHRLAVTVSWTNQFNNTSGTGTPVSLSDETGRFSFTDPSDVELVLKALYFGTNIRIFYGALSDLGYVITVTDTATGNVRGYNNPPGNYCGGIDNNAF